MLTSCWQIYTIPDDSGIDIIRLFKQINPNGLATVISALSDERSIMKALEFGAMESLHKDDSSLHIIDAIEMALKGQSPMSSSIAYSLICRIQNTSFAPLPTTPEPSSNPDTILTKRETEILDLIAKGLSFVLNMFSQNPKYAASGQLGRLRGISTQYC